MAAAEEKRILAAIKCRTCRASNPIAQLVANNSAENPRKKQPPQGDYILAGEDAGCDEKGITRQKKPDEQARLHENDGAYEGAKKGRAYPSN